MPLDPRKKRPARVRVVRLVCRRTGRQTAVRDHLKCPYCFGRASAVRAGAHQQFCEFHEGRDPISFGFRADGSRERFG